MGKCRRETFQCSHFHNLDLKFQDLRVMEKCRNFDFHISDFYPEYHWGVDKCRKGTFQLSDFFFIDLRFIFRVSVSNVHEREIRKFRFNISYLPSQQSGQVRLKSWFIVTMEADNKLLNYLPQQIFKGHNFARICNIEDFSLHGEPHWIAKGWYQVKVS